jgi:hypothetical protein
MIFGAVSVLLSIIPSTIANTITIVAFKCTGLLLDVVLNIVSRIADIRFCSIHIFKENLITAIILCLIIIGIGLLVLKIKYRRVIPVVCGALCVCITFVSFALPMTERFGTEITVHNSGNGMLITVKAGLEYMHFNFSTEATGFDYDRMPVSTSEESKLLYIGGADRETDYTSELFISQFKPETTVATRFVKEAWDSEGKAFPENTIISYEHKFKVNDKIEVTTVDTYILSCAIIELYGKRAALLYRGDIETMIDRFGVPDMLVTTRVEYRDYENINNVVISSDSKIVFDRQLLEMRRRNENVYVIAENDTVTINLREI